MSYDSTRPRLAERTLILFAQCPYLTLSSSELMHKFGVPESTSLRRYFRSAIQRGLIACTVRGPRHTEWSAGPALLQELGEEEEA